MIKRYNNYIEDKKLNEGLKELIGKPIDKIINFFKRNFGKNSWLYYLKYLMDQDKIPTNKVEIIIPKNYFENIKKHGIKSPLAEEILSNKRKSIEKKYSSDEDGFNESIDSIDSNESHYNITLLNENEVSDIKSNSVTLSYPTEDGQEEVVRDVNAAELVKRVERVYEMNLLRSSRHENDKYSKKSKFRRKKTHALMIWGAPGIGKTAIIKQLAEKHDMMIQEWHLSQLEPTDFIGVPKIETKDNHRVTTHKLPELFPSSDGNGKGGIIFFDELNRAPQLVINSALSLCLNGRIGDYELPPRWIVIAAGNRPSDLPAMEQSKLTDDPIMWNRFGHVNYLPTVEKWVDYASKLPWINPYLFGFFETRKEYFHKYNPDNEDTKAFPTPRKWEDASKEEYAILRKRNWDIEVPLDKLLKIYHAHVGYEAAHAFIDFLKLRKYITKSDLKAIYDGTWDKKNVKFPENQNPLIRWAVGVTIIYYIHDRKLTLDEYESLTNFILTIKNNEFLTMLIGLIKRGHKYTAEDPLYSEVRYKLMTEWNSRREEQEK